MQFDAIIIGTGQAGPTLASRLAASGMKTAIIEKDKFGGTCVNTGCTPTKAMVASARAAHLARRADDYGIRIDGPVNVDMSSVIARKNELVNASTRGVEKWLKETENLTVFEGHARFTSNRVLEVNGKELQSDRIFINVGGRPRIPAGYEEVPVLTNDHMVNLDTLPGHLMIVGGSYIGIEFGQMFRRFGSDVTIIEKEDRLVGREDTDVSENIADILTEEGITLRLEADCLSGKNVGNKIGVNVDCKTGDTYIEGTHLLMATGRVPNTDDLGIENTEIKRDDRGYITVDDKLQATVDGIWALGDCNGRGAFTHTAYNDYEIVAANILDNDPRSVTDRILCYSLFMDPALARIGMTEEQVRASGEKALIGTRPMSKIARAKEKGETHGFMKILVSEDTERILGATILGVEGDEVIHSLLDIMYADVSYKIVARSVPIHPTVSELIPTVLQNLKPLD